MSNISFNKEAENEEMIKLYAFFNKNKNKILFAVIAIAAIILGFNWYSQDQMKTRQKVADKLFIMQQDFNNGAYEKVISQGEEIGRKFSGFEQAGDMQILFAKALLKSGNKDKAETVLVKVISDNGNNGLIVYSGNYMLAGIYMDKYSVAKDQSFALKAAGFYEKAGKSCDNVFQDDSIYRAAESYLKAGESEKAKLVLKPLYEKVEEIQYTMRDKVKKLYKKM